MSRMSGGKRKSRKPQKWEDYVADEEQLASLEKELEKEEKARMLSMDEDSSSREKVSEEDEEEERTKMIKEEEEIKEEKEGSEEDDEKGKLQIDEVDGSDDKEEEMENKSPEEIGEGDDRKDESQPFEEDKKEGQQFLSLGEGDQIIGECKSCGIQLRDWDTTQNHLRFHRLSYVPNCINALQLSTKRFSCQICVRGCQTKDVLAYHAYTEHYRAGRKVCPFCSYTFPSMVELQEHLDFDIIGLRCQICDIVINEEHKFYNHAAACAMSHQLEVPSLTCQVCGKDTNREELTEHMIQHSTLHNIRGHLSQRVKRSIGNAPKANPPRQQQTRFRPFLCELCDRRDGLYSEFKRHLYSHLKTRSYVCTHCGKSYCQKNTLIVHLYSYHNASPKAEEIVPKEDMEQRSCDMCSKAGFVNKELLIRHYVLRCPQRDELQQSFAAILISLAKKLNLNFNEVLSQTAMKIYLRLGIEAWDKKACVREHLEQVVANKTVTEPRSIGRQAIEFTDIQLLENLKKFETKHAEHDKELEYLMNPQAKEGAVVKQVLSASSNGAKDVQVGADALCGTGSASSNEAPTVNTSEGSLNLSHLMQHLSKGGEKRKGSEDASPIDICLVTSTTNTQVTITPAGGKAQEKKPPKIARSVSHKPSLIEIEKDYPGVAVLKAVDFSRIPGLILEMQDMMESKVKEEMEKAGILPEDIQRLEMEAQYLREAEPFYLCEDDRWKLPRCGSLLNGQAVRQCRELGTGISDEVTNLLSEIKGTSDKVLSIGSFTLNDPNFVPNEKDVQRLLKEARELTIYSILKDLTAVNNACNHQRVTTTTQHKATSPGEDYLKE